MQVVDELTHAESVPEHQLQPETATQEGQSTPMVHPVHVDVGVPAMREQLLPGVETQESPGGPWAPAPSHQIQPICWSHCWQLFKPGQLEPAGQSDCVVTKVPPPFEHCGSFAEKQKLFELPPEHQEQPLPKHVTQSFEFVQVADEQLALDRYW